MALQNRVLPSGDIVAIPERGTLMGNRGGALHDAAKRLTARRFISARWICCEIAFRSRHREVMAPGRYTELFFLDEATALAAGHRPCFECRRQDANLFASLWALAHGLTKSPSARAIDRTLHAERIAGSTPRKPRRYDAARLPDGAIYRDPTTGEPRLTLADGTLLWTPSGYRDWTPRMQRDEVVSVLTPPSIVAVLAAGYRPRLHQSATA